MSDFTPEVRGRFARAVMLAMHHGLAADWNIIIHHIDALEARVAVLEGKALAYDAAQRGDFCDRAHALAKDVRGAWGRNVWHVAVELAEQNKARVAVLAAECRAERALRNNQNTHGDWQTHEECMQAAIAARAATDAAGALEGGRS